MRRMAVLNLITIWKWMFLNQHIPKMHGQGTERWSIIKELLHTIFQIFFPSTVIVLYATLLQSYFESFGSCCSWFTACGFTSGSLGQTEMFCCILIFSSMIQLWLSQQSVVSVSPSLCQGQRDREVLCTAWCVVHSDSGSLLLCTLLCRDEDCVIVE